MGSPDCSSGAHVGCPYGITWECHGQTTMVPYGKPRWAPYGVNLGHSLAPSGLYHLRPRWARSGEIMWAPYGSNLGLSLVSSELSHLGPRQARSGEFMWAPHGANMGRNLTRHDYPINDPVQYSNLATISTLTRTQGKHVIQFTRYFAATCSRASRATANIDPGRGTQAVRPESKSTKSRLSIKCHGQQKLSL